LRAGDASLSRDQALPLRLRDACYFAAAPVAGASEAIDIGCRGGEAAVGVVGAVTGVTMTPVTWPLTASFCFLLVVPRATRVALAFAIWAARCSVVNGVRALGGPRPKSASVCVAFANAARTRRL
jgi:hypothetical protein